MTKHLKQILFNIARLPSVDQTWILRRLSSSELKTLNKFRGLKLLQDAQRFRTLKPGDANLPIEEIPDPLPEFCQQLAMKAPLYAAIVIEQGAYPWANMFLDQFDADGVIQTLLENQVLDVKPVIKQAVFNEWEKSSSLRAQRSNPVPHSEPLDCFAALAKTKSPGSFEQLLDVAHG